jgi:xanthine/CO dehydrogenase XdhC/CoxF family maturation factor
MTIRDLQASFAAWCEVRKPLVLASVYETEGSTYSKSGARMLIAADGTFQGMLSGGCLEGDLAERALAVLESNTPQCVTYDLGRNDEELWGLGVGCDGLMRIFLQPLLPEEGYQPFAAMASVLSGDFSGVAATVLESGHGPVAPGATLVMCNGEVVSFGVPDACRAAFVAASQTAALEMKSGTRVLDVGDHGDHNVKVLTARLLPPPRLLILGAGLDALPVLRLAVELGWRVTVQDHRPAYIERGDFSSADKVSCLPAVDVAGALTLDRYDAVIVMSHHLATDRKYLRMLTKTQIPYVGLLGPPDRRSRLMEDLGDAANSLQYRLHGPAGFDIGADGPASIALSILAEIHAELKHKSLQEARAVEPIRG